jgi:hypothetical protein
MRLRVRRIFVILGVIVSLVVGVLSIQIAAALTAAAAPPPAPPVSIGTLKTELAAEQARSAALQQQLQELLSVSDTLSQALNTTSDQVSTDGLSADQLRQRLQQAQTKLSTVTALLNAAQAKLASMQAAINSAGSSGSGGSTTTTGGGSSGSGGSSATTPPAAPTAAPAAPTPAPATFSATVTAGGVLVSWPMCTASGFSRYAVVRSTDSEIHYPPEDFDTLAASITSSSTTSYLDPVGSGTYWYRVWCLTSSGGEILTAWSTGTAKVTVP